MEKRLFKYVMEQYHNGKLTDRVTRYKEHTDEEARLYISHESQLWPSYKITAYVADLPEFEYFVPGVEDGEE